MVKFCKIILKVNEIEEIGNNFCEVELNVVFDTGNENNTTFYTEICTHI